MQPIDGAQVGRGLQRLLGEQSIGTAAAEGINHAGREHTGKANLSTSNGWLSSDFHNAAVPHNHGHAFLEASVGSDDGVGLQNHGILLRQWSEQIGEKQGARKDHLYFGL